MLFNTIGQKSPFLYHLRFLEQVSCIGPLSAAVRGPPASRDLPADPAKLLPPYSGFPGSQAACHSKAARAITSTVTPSLTLTQAKQQLTCWFVTVTIFGAEMYSLYSVALNQLCVTCFLHSRPESYVRAVIK